MPNSNIFSNSLLPKDMKGSELQVPLAQPKNEMNTHKNGVANPKKPHFRPAQDDTKPLLRDPILRSDPMEAEEAVLRLPPFPKPK